MAITPVGAFGRITIHYSTYNKPHVARYYVPAFNFDAGVGTFVATLTPASLNAFATSVCNIMGPLFNAAADFTPGNWEGETYVPGSGNSFISRVTGTVTGVSFTPNAGANAPGAVSQNTWSFRAADGKVVRFEQFGSTYVDSAVFYYSSIGGAFLAYADYVMASQVIQSRSGAAIEAMISLSQDTNDGLTRRYRR